MTQPWWYVPYLNAERSKLSFEGSLNGITIQVAPVDVGSEWTCEQFRHGDVSAAAGSKLAISPSYLPQYARLSDGAMNLSMECDGEVVIAEATYDVLVPDDAPTGVRGGSFSLFRYAGSAVASVAIPADRWRAGEIAGHPAAIARPILDNGLGTSAVIVSHDGSVTRVIADGLTLDEVIRIAEGLFK